MSPVELVQKLPLSSGLPKELRKVRIKQVDAFTEIPLTGNPAGVVFNAQSLTDQEMQTIAREMAVSETAFILPATTPAASLRIRWFTPQTEAPLCGHATVAAFHALAEDEMFGMKGAGSFSFKLETKSGILPVTVEKTLNTIDVFFGLTLQEFVRAGQYKLDVMRILNISLDEFENRLPIVVSNYLYVPIRRLHSIFSMKPNFFAMSQFLSNRNIIGLCVFTTETVDRKSSVHSRFFAPTVGINEDPVTGSANGPLGAYLFEQGELKPIGDSVTIIGEQGDVIGRKGRVTIQLDVRGAEVTAIRIGGRAVTILDGEMLAG
ncbi:MAG TPA: PhzF family phenazine biosynthesis protein [Bacteroidota bacterium]|nr:PhzF family phenazine biosynthesis protein [Bacteroidota bacterium]